MQTNHSCRAERWRQTVRPKNLKIFPIWPLQKRLGDPSITNRGLDMRHNDRHMGSDSKNPKQAMNLPDYVLGRTMYTQAHVHTKELSETCPPAQKGVGSHLRCTHMLTSMWKGMGRDAGLGARCPRQRGWGQRGTRSPSGPHHNVWTCPFT